MAQRFLVTVKSPYTLGRKYAWKICESLSKCTVDLWKAPTKSEHAWKRFKQYDYFDSAKIELPMEYLE